MRNGAQKWIACMKEQSCSHQFAGSLQPQLPPEHMEELYFHFTNSELTPVLAASV